MATNKFEYFNIGEAYIKYNLDFTESNKMRIKEAYLKQVGFKAKDFFKDRELIKISIEYEKGSLKAKIILWGTTIYFGIGAYSDFRSGVRELVNDVKSFSSYVIEQMESEPSITPDLILNSQKRTGITGRVDEVYRRIDHLEKNINSLSNVQIQKELFEIKQEIASLAEVLPSHDTQQFISSLSDQYKQNLPQPDNERTHYLYSRYALKPEDETNFIDE
jgi:hypothetical protein